MLVSIISWKEITENCHSRSSISSLAALQAFPWKTLCFTSIVPKDWHKQHRVSSAVKHVVSTRFILAENKRTKQGMGYTQVNSCLSLASSYITNSGGHRHLLFLTSDQSSPVPFHQPQQLQCLHHGGTFVPLYAPILFSQLHIGDNLLDRCVMASVQDRKITEALFILFLAYNVMKWVRHCWNQGIMAFIWGVCFTNEFSVSSVIAG